MPRKKATKKKATKKKTTRKRATKKKEQEEIDVDQILLHTRQLFLNGAINDETAFRVNKRLLALSSISNDPIALWINSPGGSVYSGFSIIDTIRGLNCPVCTFVCGYACSMGGLISIAGKTRIMTSNSIWMAHEMHTGCVDYAGKFIARTEHIKVLDKKIRSWLSDHTKLSSKEIEEAMRGELWLDAKGAFEKGIVDHIAEV